MPRHQYAGDGLRLIAAPERHAGHMASFLAPRAVAFSPRLALTYGLVDARPAGLIAAAKIGYAYFPMQRFHLFWAWQAKQKTCCRRAAPRFSMQDV